jgi:hypothetical protein
MPPMRVVKDLYYKMPFWYPFRFTLTSQQTLEFTQVARHNFKLLTLASIILKTEVEAGSYSAQIYDVARRRSFSRLPVWDGNLGGVAGQRYWIREPYLFRAGTTILVQVHNLTTNNLTAELLMEGVRTDG